MPSGVIGQRIQSLIETVNAGDPDRVRRFLEEECTERFRAFAPMEEHLAVFASLKREAGSFAFHSIRTYTPQRPTETVVILRDANFGSWHGFVLRFDGTAEQRVAGLQFTGARTPTDVEEAELSQAELVRETGNLVRRVCEQDVFSGTVLVAHGDEVLLTHACGEASKRFHVANDIDTRFNLGSMNKMFTATAIVRLVERGVLSYDDPISQYVDESWLPREITDKITIHHLLTHTSGLGSYFNDTYWNGSRELYRDVDDFKPLVRGEELAFEPGTRFLYSNTGMLLLGVVIERATGESYFEHIRKQIYEPAGMEHSDSYDMDAPVENLAIGYVGFPRSEICIGLRALSRTAHSCPRHHGSGCGRTTRVTATAMDSACNRGRRERSWDTVAGSPGSTGTSTSSWTRGMWWRCSPTTAAVRRRLRGRSRS
jgi:CubicO group peptidase (beta-lactamase class C family)